MVDAFQLIGLIYIASGGLYAVSRELSFSRWVRLHGLRIMYGSNPATIHEKESIQYFRIVAAIMALGGGTTFGLLSQIATSSEFLPVLMVNLPFLVSIFALGFDTHVIDLNGMVGVYPRGPISRFGIAFMFAFAYPFISGLSLVISGLVPSVDSFLAGIFLIPFVLVLTILLVPFLLGDWLFGTKNFAEALPPWWKTYQFRFLFTLALALLWSEMVRPGYITLVGIALCFLLYLGLTKIADDDSYV